MRPVACNETREFYPVVAVLPGQPLERVGAEPARLGVGNTRVGAFVGAPGDAVGAPADGEELRWGPWSSEEPKPVDESDEPWLVDEVLPLLGELVLDALDGVAPVPEAKAQPAKVVTAMRGSAKALCMVTTVSAAMQAPQSV